MKKSKSLRPIAFVLPQFHPIPENDEWWGEGFTEWTNVRKAKPLFRGHYQPHVPTTLGYYDLRDPEARASQAKLAQEHGIEGFCYYHYWFNGKRLLNTPIDEILRLKEPDMPFMLCWANENWTRRWDGLDQEVLIKQEYSLQDDKKHMRWLCKHVFKDKRYIRVDDKPVFMVYRQDLFPNIKETALIWREIAKNEFGLKDLYLCVVESFNKRVNPDEIGFDASIEFSPHKVMTEIYKPNFYNKLFRKNINKNNIRDFKLGVKRILSEPEPNYKYFRCVTPAWDNSPRKGNSGFIGINSSPNLFYYWWKEILKRFKPYSKEENFIFINAMNEWAEGNHLEPCQKYGPAYLGATKRALDELQ